MKLLTAQVILSVLCLGGAIALMAYSKAGWGWLLFLTVLILSAGGKCNCKDDE